TRSRRPHRRSCSTPLRRRAWVETVSEGRAARSSTSTRWPWRARSIAVDAPATRPPTTTTSTSRLMMLLSRRASGHRDVDRDRGPVGEHVVDGRAGDRPLHDLAERPGLGAAFDGDVHLYAAEAVADRLVEARAGPSGRCRPARSS